MNNGKHAMVAFIGLAWCIFLLWSPGWSPQWVLYLIPLILLALPEREAVLMAASLVLVNLLEWPVLLSRGYAWGLWLTIPVRILLLALLAVELWRVVRERRLEPGVEREAISRPHEKILPAGEE